MSGRTLQVVSVETTESADAQIAAPRIHIHGRGPERGEHHSLIFESGSHMPSRHHGSIWGGE